MSRPGYPIDATENTTVHNSYDTWNGQHFSGSESCLTRKRYEDKSGNNTPGWPSHVQTNSYLRSSFTWEQSPLDVNGTVDQGGGHFDHSSGQFGTGYGAGYYPWGDPIFATSEIDSVRERLIGKLIDQIQSHRVNLGEVLHTRAQTASMVASTANRLAGSFMALRRGNFVGAARYLTGADPRTRTRIRVSKSGRVTSGLGGIPEQWLALKYGWQPALQDVYNSCKTVQQAWNDNGELFSAKASASAEPGRISFLRGPAVAWGPRYRIETGSRKVSGKASVHYKVDSSIGTNLSQLGVTNPASLAWELLPYSFVVDWFYPVGSFLERLDFSRGLSFAYGWISIKTEQDVVQRLEDHSKTYSNISSTFSGANGQGKARLFTREALSSFPPVPPPRLKDPFSLTHAANALALLATAFRGGKIPR